MNEVQRQLYLKKFGVMLWYSRRNLPGAAPSPEFDFSDERKTRDVPDPDFVIALASSPATNSKDARYKQGDVEKAAPDLAPEKKFALKLASSSVDLDGEKVAPEAEQVAAPFVITDALRTANVKIAVDLRLIQVKGLIVIAEVGKELSGEIQEKLIGNILAALGYAEAPDSVTELSWPVFSNIQAPGNDRFGLILSLRGLLAPFTSCTLLALGAELELLSSQSGNSPDPWPHGGARLFFGHDLCAIAASGQLKQQLWHLIRSSTALQKAQGFNG